ncbi:unnamed protein product [Candidula unifasciata]|uniref:Major facilitator superfamily associated domain-containing protein n=1 Tax=Candidula unifasciata TaxID=100452 RepID=A0A8S3ZSA7_9EUPU|nr:unnamed protein product [Candidula unifasciata]
MATTHDTQHHRQSEFDPLDNSKRKTSDGELNLHGNEEKSHKRHKTSRPFNRDFIDSLFTVVNKDLLYCKLFYFFFFGAFGSLFPLLAIYFKQLGMNASQSGVLIGFRPFIEFLSAPFWGGLADKWRRGKEMLLFSLVCWIVFTLAIAFVQPPAHKCLTFNGTHNLLEAPLGRSRRFAKSNSESIFDKSLDSVPESIEYTFDIDSSNRQHTMEHASTYSFPKKATIVLPKDLTPFYAMSRCRRSPQTVDTSKIANLNASNVRGLVFNPHSSVVYQEDEVARAFFILLLLVVTGEFFSAPAITFADSVTLSFLGEDTQNYGRQRMFGSLGWGLAMFFVGMALDHSTTFPDHPCGKAHIREKNYTVCFAVFSVLMSCAFLAAMQFRFDHHKRENSALDVPGKIKAKFRRIFSKKTIDRERLVEEFSDDEHVVSQKDDGQANSYTDLEKGVEGSDLKINPAVKNDMVTDALTSPNSKNTDVMGAIPFGSAEANYSDQPFFGRWIAVVKLLATYKYISVLFIAWFMGFGIGIIFTFLFWHLQDMGGSPTLFGVASVINHMSELFAYFMAGTFIGRYGHVKILYAGLLGSIARFLYISFLTNPWWVLPFEFVQGLTHAAVWAACCAYITHAIPVELRSSAQGILQGLHHGLGRGCGAVFGGLLVYQYGSVVTFRIYGITCIIVLITYFGINMYLQKQGKFSHNGRLPQELVEDNAHLAPHGVPSGVARNLSSTTNTHLTEEPQPVTEVWILDDEAHAGSKQKGLSACHEESDTLEKRIASLEAPRQPKLIYQNQSRNSHEKDYES